MKHVVFEKVVAPVAVNYGSLKVVYLKLIISCRLGVDLFLWGVYRREGGFISFY